MKRSGFSAIKRCFSDVQDALIRISKQVNSRFAGRSTWSRVTGMFALGTFHQEHIVIMEGQETVDEPENAHVTGPKQGFWLD